MELHAIVCLNRSVIITLKTINTKKPIDYVNTHCNYKAHFFHKWANTVYIVFVYTWYSFQHNIYGNVDVENPKYRLDPFNTKSIFQVNDNELQGIVHLMNHVGSI